MPEATSLEIQFRHISTEGRISEWAISDLTCVECKDEKWWVKNTMRQCSKGGHSANLWWCHAFCVQIRGCILHVLWNGKSYKNTDEKRNENSEKIEKKTSGIQAVSGSRLSVVPAEEKPSVQFKGFARCTYVGRKLFPAPYHETTERVAVLNEVIRSQNCWSFIRRDGRTDGHDL